MCVLYKYNDTDLTRSDSIINYFMGHKMVSKMMENYTHINKVDNKTFYNNYGKFVIDMLDNFIFRSEEYNEKIKNYVNAFMEKRLEENNDLLNEEGNIDFEKGIQKILKPLIDTLREKKPTRLV